MTDVSRALDGKAGLHFSLVVRTIVSPIYLSFKRRMGREPQPDMWWFPINTEETVKNELPYTAHHKDVIFFSLSKGFI